MIEILQGGVLNTVQDVGRVGWLASGVSIAGAMDLPALEVANCLVGNPRFAAGIEIQMFPFRVRALADTGVSVTGADCEATIDDVVLPPWWAKPMREGQTLKLSAPRTGARAYVAFSGGIDVPLLLGSRATDVRGGFGGHRGKGLGKGDCLRLGTTCSGPLPAAGWGAAPNERVRHIGDAPPIRTIPAAEHRSFKEEAIRRFLGSPWSVTKEANRMGFRLSGQDLELERPIELFSHGIVPGTIQVPPSGQPIIQLAD